MGGLGARPYIHLVFTSSRVAFGGRWKIWWGVGFVFVGKGKGFALLETCLGPRERQEQNTVRCVERTDWETKSDMTAEAKVRLGSRSGVSRTRAMVHIG